MRFVCRTCGMTAVTTHRTEWYRRLMRVVASVFWRQGWAWEQCAYYRLTEAHRDFQASINP